jgi:hypothetical protein
MRILGKAAVAVVMIMLTLSLSSVAGYAGSEYVGVWKLEDTKGEPFQITLSESGEAQGRHVDKEMKGSWKEVDGAAVITWGTGWFTKISKDGNGYRKTAYKKSLSDPPTSSSAAVKVH